MDYDRLMTQSDRMLAGELKELLEQVPDNFVIQLGWSGQFTEPDRHEIQFDVDENKPGEGTVTLQCDGDSYY